MLHPEKRANGWVFLSHSSQDYEDIKIVRNYLEESGFSALMFYLKSLENPKKRKLTQQLIKWEIEARNIFVLCNSKSAKKSKWVKEEQDYVKSFPEKIYVEIDIDRLKYEKCTQLSKLDNLIKRATLFFSYSSKDKEFVIKFYDYLKSEGFKIWMDYQDLKIGDNLFETINKALIEAIENGYVLLFISKNYLESQWCKAELETAINLQMKKEASILPIIIDENLDISDLNIIRNTMPFNIYTQDFEIKKRELLKALNRVRNDI